MSICITDQLNNVINFSFPPERIVSLVPSQTELLYDLGLDEEVIGITKFCIHPKVWFRQKTRIGGTKTVDVGKVKNLQPDLIIANKEENVKEQIEELRHIAPLYISDINSLNDALDMIGDIGKLVDKQERARTLINKLEEAFKQLKPVNQPVNTAYLIWKNPYMAAGGNTFINDMLNRCGLKNVFQNTNRYPEVTIDRFSNATCQSSGDWVLTSANCQLVLLSSEPYPFKQKHIEELQLQLPQCKISLVDGEMFSWYGSRLLYAAEYFKNLIEQIQG